MGKNLFSKMVLGASLLLVLFGFTACGTEDSTDNNTDNTDNNVTLKSVSTGKEMVDEIKNYSYNVTITVFGNITKVSGKVNFDDKVAYENVNATMQEVIEKTYYDYNTGYKYYKATAEGWSKSKLEDLEDEEALKVYSSYIILTDYLKDVEVTDVDGGKKYVGTLDMDALDGEESSKEVENFVGDTTFEVVKDSNGYVKSIKINTLTNAYETENNLEILVEYKDINTTGSVVVPNEAKEAE